MKEISVSMSRKAYEQYLKPEKSGGYGLKSKENLIKYLNSTGNYFGIVTNVAVDREDIKTVYTNKVASDILYEQR